MQQQTTSTWFDAYAVATDGAAGVAGVAAGATGAACAADAATAAAAAAAAAAVGCEAAEGGSDPLVETEAIEAGRSCGAIVWVVGMCGSWLADVIQK